MYNWCKCIGPRCHQQLWSSFSSVELLAKNLRDFVSPEWKLQWWLFLVYNTAMYAWRKIATWYFLMMRRNHILFACHSEHLALLIKSNVTSFLLTCYSRIFLYWLGNIYSIFVLFYWKWLFFYSWIRIESFVEHKEI